MATVKEIIDVLKNDQIILASAKLNKLVRSLDLQHKREKKIARQYATCIALMSDGMEYDEAYQKSLKVK